MTVGCYNQVISIKTVFKLCHVCTVLTILLAFITLKRSKSVILALCKYADEIKLDVGKWWHLHHLHKSERNIIYSTKYSILGEVHARLKIFLQSKQVLWIYACEQQHNGSTTWYKSVLNCHLKITVHIQQNSQIIHLHNLWKLNYSILLTISNMQIFHRNINFSSCRLQS